MTAREYVNRIFEDDEIHLDGITAHDVIFKNCVLYFDGGDFSAHGCDFESCHFVFSNDDICQEFMTAMMEQKA